VVIIARRRVLPWLALALLGCRSAPSSGQLDLATSKDRAFVSVLPDDAGPFVAATRVQTGEGFFRRTYAAGSHRLEVTVARMSGSDGAYERWVEGSRDYPQVALPVPSDQANGFFTCADPAGEGACDVHIQFRAGVHVEGMGDGRVPKADWIRLLGRLNLAALADPSILPI
jgi:hypothetical protein